MRGALRSAAAVVAAGLWIGAPMMLGAQEAHPDMGFKSEVKAGAAPTSRC